MATRGRKPTATVLRLVRGNPGKRAVATTAPLSDGAPVKPARLKGRAGQLWDEFVATAPWLGRHDGPKALVWCHLQARFERKPGDMAASMIAQLRACGSELGLDPGSRQRIGARKPDGPKDPADGYF